MNKQEIRELLVEPLTEYAKEKIANELEMLDAVKYLILNDRCQIFYYDDKKAVTLELLGSDFEIEGHKNDKTYMYISKLKEW